MKKKENFEYKMHGKTIRVKVLFVILSITLFLFTSCVKPTTEEKKSTPTEETDSTPTEETDSTPTEETDSTPTKELKQWYVSTFAGSTQGYQEGKGTAAHFNTPSEVDITSDGTLYVADLLNHRIRKITPDGDVTTLAGSGTGGFQDGKGTATRFHYPSDVAVASDGTIYVADLLNHRIRKITPDGDVTTLAGSIQGYQDGRGAVAKFNQPDGIAVAKDGTIYVADTANHRIRKITPEGDVTTIAGSGMEGFQDGRGAVAKFDNPSDVTIAPDGTLYVTDTGNNRIRKITPEGDVTTIAGSGMEGFQDGKVTEAKFKGFDGIVVAKDGTIYVADALNYRIRKITPEGDVTTIAGNDTKGSQNGKGIAAQFVEPYGIAITSDGIIYVADSKDHHIRKLEYK